MFKRSAVYAGMPDILRASDLQPDDRLHQADLAAVLAGLT